MLLDLELFLYRYVILADLIWKLFIHELLNLVLDYRLFLALHHFYFILNTCVIIYCRDLQMICYDL